MRLLKNTAIILWACVRVWGPALIGCAILASCREDESREPEPEISDPFRPPELVVDIYPEVAGKPLLIVRRLK